MICNNLKGRACLPQWLTLSRTGIGFCLCLALLGSGLRGASFAPVFGSNMVLQRDRPIPVWGTAAPGEDITVHLGEEERAATASPEGKWEIAFAPLAAGGPVKMSITSRQNGKTIRHELTNILIGDVWLCSGQSNMVYGLQQIVNENPGEGYEAAIANARYPAIRFAKAPTQYAGEPADGIALSWKPVSPESIKWQSAVAYHFGRGLHDNLDVPIGLVVCAVGASAAEAWTPQSVLEKNPNYARILKRFADARAHYEERLARWEENGSTGKKPEPPHLARPQDEPHQLYNGMIHPLVRFPVCGVIWYQGENNTSRPHEYYGVFTTLIRSWREAFGQPDMPFLFVQLAGFNASKDRDWPTVRAAQAKAQSLPHTGMAVAIDVGKSNNIHPPRKKEVGERLARIALKQVYGQDIVTHGPVLSEAERTSDGKVLLTFDTGGPPLMSPPGDTLDGFEVSQDAHNWIPASARIVSKNQLQILVDDDVKIQHVRYAWTADPEATLFNAEGLPAGPFSQKLDD